MISLTTTYIWRPRFGFGKRDFPTIYEDVLILLCLFARRRKADAKCPHGGRTVSAEWTHGARTMDAKCPQFGRKLDARRTQDARVSDAKWTQNRRVLDSVSDKLFLGSTVNIQIVSINIIHSHSSFLPTISSTKTFSKWSCSYLLNGRRFKANTIFFKCALIVFINF